MGVHAEILAASDSKPFSQQFIAANRPSLKHMYGSLEDQLKPDGACMMPLHANCSAQLREVQPDLMSIGGICQPFSRARAKKGGTPKTSGCDAHPGYETTLELVPLLLDMRKPRVFILEEINEFDFVKKGCIESACVSFIKTVMAGGWFTGVAQLSMDVGVFNQSSRSRLYLGFFSPEVGGQQGADRWQRRCLEAYNSFKVQEREPLMGGTLTLGEIQSVQLQALCSGSRAVALDLLLLYK